MSKTEVAAPAAAAPGGASAAGKKKVKKLTPAQLRKQERIADKLRENQKAKRKIPVPAAISGDNYHPDLDKYIHRESNTTLVNFTSAWSQLSEREKNYAYYISKASWAGAKMVFHQMSYESPPLFLLFQAFFQDKNPQAIFNEVK